MRQTVKDHDSYWGVGRSKENDYLILMLVNVTRQTVKDPAQIAVGG
jgi:hypothetical protein